MAKLVTSTGGASAEPAKRRNRRVDVIQAAIEAFWLKGYAASSVQDVADRVGVLKGSLYYYIDSKEGLLVQILEDVHEKSRKILDDVVALDVGPTEQLRIYIERHVEFYLENVKEVTVYFRDWRYLTGERLDTVRTQRRKYDKVIQDLIRAAQARGEVDEGVDPKYASFFILAAVNHVPDWYRPGKGDKPSVIAGQFADLAVGTMVGTRPRPAPGDSVPRTAAKPTTRRPRPRAQR